MYSSKRAPALSDVQVCSEDTDLRRKQVQSHLEDVLLSPVFRNTKRYSGMLRYVVEQSLEGRTDHLKERTIGIEVFGRAADYDTNADHSVRSAAGEVRRRLAQYYLETGIESGVRIELVPGSYVPQIRFCEPTLVRSEDSGALLVSEPLVHKEFQDSSPRRTKNTRRSLSALVPAGIAALVLLGVTATIALRSPTPFEKLWGPVLSAPKEAMLCFGGGGGTNPAEQPVTFRDFERSPMRRMNVADAMAMIALTNALETKGKPYRILNRASVTSYKELQQGPYILVGGLNNEWTLRLISNLRFAFERQEGGARVADRQHPDHTAWSFSYDAPFNQPTRDYAIVTRLRDPMTDQTGIIVAGIGSWGTQAAAEFVSNPTYLRKLDEVAPAHWEKRNFQIVIGTDVIRGSSGPAILLATHFW